MIEIKDKAGNVLRRVVTPADKKVVRAELVFLKSLLPKKRVRCTNA